MEDNNENKTVETEEEQELNSEDVNSAAEEFDVKEYLDENGLIEKWEPTGMFQEVSTNPEKFFIASIMEAMIYKSVYLMEKHGKTSEEMVEYQEKYLSHMASIGVFNGELLKQISE